MHLKIPAGLRRATSLVHSGKLIEASGAIQRALRGGVVAPATDAGRTEAATIADSCRTVEVTKPARTPGRFVTWRYTNTAGTREYRIYIPTVYRGQALPLLVMLHGCHQAPDDFAAATRMNALAEEHAFFVVYPKQAEKANGSSCWNWFQAEHQQRDRGEPSLIAGITREAVALYALNARRVYVAGLSAGGAMATIMGTTYPDLYAAVGVHSGLAYAAAHDVSSAWAAMRGEGSNRGRPKPRVDASAYGVPTIVFHGDADTTVDPSNSDELIEQAWPAESIEKARDNTFAEHERTVEHGDIGGRAYTRTAYRGTGGKLIMEQWIVHGATHAWSGGSAEGSFSDPTGPDASREMLRFFLQHQNAS